MALDDMQDAEHGDAVFTLAIDAGRAASPASSTSSRSPARPAACRCRRCAALPDTPNGLMEFLLCETFAWGREHGIEPRLAELQRVRRAPARRGDDLPRWQRLLRFAPRQGRPLLPGRAPAGLQPQVLPEWEPRYAAFERYADVPLGALVTLSVESLVDLAARRCGACTPAGAA